MYAPIGSALTFPSKPIPASRNYFDNIRTQQEGYAGNIFLQTLRESVFHLREVFKNDNPITWQGPRDTIIFKPDRAAYKTTMQAGENPARSIPILDLSFFKHLKDIGTEDLLKGLQINLWH